MVTSDTDAMGVPATGSLYTSVMFTAGMLTGMENGRCTLPATTPASMGDAVGEPSGGMSMLNDTRCTSENMVRLAAPGSMAARLMLCTASMSHCGVGASSPTYTDSPTTSTLVFSPTRYRENRREVAASAPSTSCRSGCTRPVRYRLFMPGCSVTLYAVAPPSR